MKKIKPPSSRLGTFPMTDGKSSHGRFAVIPPAPHVPSRGPRAWSGTCLSMTQEHPKTLRTSLKTETYSASAFPAWNGEFTQLGIERRDFHMQQGRCSVFAAHAPPRHRHDLTQVPFFQLFQCRQGCRRPPPDWRKMAPCSHGRNENATTRPARTELPPAR